MGIFEVILAGYMINGFSLGFSIVYVTITSIVSTIKNGPMEMGKYSLVLQELSHETKELRKGVKWQFKHDMDNYAILFPFMHVLSTIKLLFGSLRFGLHNYLLYKMQNEVQRLERYWQNIEDKNVDRR